MSCGTFAQVEKDWARFAAFGRPPRIALVGCGASKADHPAPARALYTGELFKKSMAWAEKFADKVLILSGRWGLVEPDYELEPYEYKLASTDVRFWSHDVVNCFLGLASRFCSGWAPRADPTAVRETVKLPGELIILAGREYADPIVERLREHPHITPVLPLDGLQIGERLAWLKSQLLAVHSEVA